MKRSAITGKLAALATAGMVAPNPAWACAMSRNISVASSSFNNLIAVLCWIGGTGFCISGAFKIRKRRKDPAKQSRKGIIVRLSVGLVLLAFPFVQSQLLGDPNPDHPRVIRAQTLKMDGVENFK